MFYLTGINALRWGKRNFLTFKTTHVDQSDVQLRAGKSNHNKTTKKSAKVIQNRLGQQEVQCHRPVHICYAYTASLHVEL